VASRRTLSPRRLHRDEHEPPGRARRCFLQQARNASGTGGTTSLVDTANATIGYGFDGAKNWNGLIDDERVYKQSAFGERDRATVSRR
jgi:hypothetical protein